MSLLDDARRMARFPPRFVDDPEDGSRCFWCDAILAYPELSNGDHSADCPWLSMPKIVKVLEMAEWLAKN